MNLKPEYLDINGRKLRVEVNWNTICDFSFLTGVDFNDFCQMASDGKVTPKDLRTMLYCAIKEGERMDGRPFELTELDLGEGIRPGIIIMFVEIFTRQWNDSKKKTMGK